MGATSCLVLRWLAGHAHCIRARHENPHVYFFEGQIIAHEGFLSCQVLLYPLASFISVPRPKSRMV